MLPLASMGQKSGGATKSYTTQSGETVTINTNAAVTQETNGTYDVNVNRSINASGTTNATGNIDATAQLDGATGATSTLTTTYNSSLGADGTKTITSQDGQVNSSTTNSQGTLTMSESGGVTSVSACGSSDCESGSSVKVYDNDVVTTTYSGSDGGSATMTYSGSKNGTSGASTRTITTSSGETISIDTSGAEYGGAQKNISVSGTTNLDANKSYGSAGVSASVNACGSSGCESGGSVKVNDDGVVTTRHIADTSSRVVSASSTYSGTKNGTSE